MAHPDETGHSGTAVVVRKSIKRYQKPDYKTEHIPATTIAVEDTAGNLYVTTVYCPP